MVLQTKKFRIVNEGFECGHCGGAVSPTSGATPRNHCPFCLWCRHVDINPGDRANPCRGMMRPIGIYSHSRKEYVILHQCTRCAERVRAKAILEDVNAADDFDRILELSGKPIQEKKPIPPHMLQRVSKKRKTVKRKKKKQGPR